MRFTIASLAVVALASQSVAGNIWGGSAAYNKWHETELERWLSDHDVPYPTPADRKDLLDKVQANWDDNVVKPYNKWDTNQLSNYMKSQGQEIKKGTEKNKDSLLTQVQSYWKETADSINEAYGNVQHWIFDTWTESQLKAFLDKHDVPNPNPRTRDSLLATARSKYHDIATKAGETAAYPGDWLYASWSDSDLKQWLDERGVPVPQTGARDKLIAQIRRNSKIASDRASEQYASLSSSAAASQSSLSDSLINSWGDSQIKEWLDKAGIPVPQGSKRNELIALARKHSAQLTAGNSASSASSYMGAATSSAGNVYAQATGDLYGSFKGYYDYVANQLGFASEEAKASYSSVASVASKSSSSLSSVASASSSSLSSAASSAASSASKQASKSGGNAASAKSAASSAASAASSSASSASSSASAKAEL